ncbi:MAG: glycerophosphoryl diester phosphodiesterase membrane domain-containing protein, partial [Steroidobacteraceae bacterium]|nr:glycerophosphoryl diester phosphodiesterase membrane domain-containing protein [Steroidobacteraceae bacterium]
MRIALDDTLYSRTGRDFRLRWKQSIGFHLLMQALGIAIFGPLATGIAHRLVSASGESVVTNFDIASYVLSPVGALFLLFVAAIAIGLLLAEFAGQSWISGHAIARRPTTVLATVAMVLQRLPAMIALGARVFLRLLLIALPFLAAIGLLWFTTLREQDINYYLAGQPPEWKRALVTARVLGVGYACVALWQLARWIFAVPQLVFEKASPRQAIAGSEHLTRGRLGRIITRVALWWTL